VQIQYGAAIVYNGDCTSGTTVSVWSLMVGIPPVGQVCDATASPDACGQYGLTCTSDGSGDAGCQLPNEFFGCNPTVGCQPGGLACTSVPATDGGDTNLCAVPCQQTSDCPDLETNCQQVTATATLCYPDFCGPGSGQTGAFFDSCNSAGTGDGTCLPVAAAGGAFGLCYAAGALGSGSACGVSRADGGADLCSTDEICIGQALPGTCAPLCGIGSDTAADGGPGCVSGSDCIQLSGSDFGACLVDCSGSGTCAGTATCTTLGALKVCVP
jgi:hypothetical protein